MTTNRAALNNFITERGKRAETPPADVLNRAPTRADVRRYPDYYICGAGETAAHAASCEHGYRLTDSCPNC